MSVLRGCDSCKVLGQWKGQYCTACFDLVRRKPRFRIDLHGKIFGRLNVKEFAGNSPSRQSLWRCACECGAEVVVFGSNLMRGHTLSCGCLVIERSKENAKRIPLESRRIAMRKSRAIVRRELLSGDRTPTMLAGSAKALARGRVAARSRNTRLLEEGPTEAEKVYWQRSIQTGS